jgi:1,4-dihydroxy-6-naphthoate synthase
MELVLSQGASYYFALRSRKIFAGEVPVQKREITLGHSPDPDHAFMFYALAEHKIDTGELIFRHIIEDIESLNRRAMRAELDVTAISIHAYSYVLDQYALLASGASMGDGYGPIVIAREAISLERLKGSRIAVPGKMTTAYLVLRLWLGEVDSVVMPFDRIMDAVQQGQVDAGLLIHEGQLTYAERGLEKVFDLGHWWKLETGLPLPLGGNAIKKALGPELISRVSRLLRESIEYGLAHRPEAVAYSMKYGRGMGEQQTDQFVSMYVNCYTLDYGEAGRRAVELLLRRGHEAGITPKPALLEFA